MGQIVRVCKASDLQAGEKAVFEVSGQSILLVNLDGRFYAVSDLCTHEHVELVNGFLLNEEIVCPAHLSRFRLEDGAVANPPAAVPLKTYKTLVEDDEVSVEL